ncbi:MAG: cation transporter [Acidimicrobiia bacterium]
MITAVLDITGMHCPSCAVLIDETLESLPGVASARTDMHRARTKVEYDPAATSLEAITAAIAEAGYDAIPA